MGRVILTISCLFILSAAGSLWAADQDTPYSIAGVRVDRPVEEFADRLIMESAMPVRFQGYLKEVELKPVAGIKTGLIAYGNCADPGHIVRIKIKYADPSKAYFERLLKRFKQRFGDPDEWRGDPFHVLIAWKWSFVDDKGNHISLTLQHNTQDRDQKMGNAVKLNLNNAIEAERNCYLDKRARQKKDVPQPAAKLPDWELLIPR